uniref:Uncharacterized protein n=1 Tax=Oryza brachyantha TaxID=4533 RepID=J3LDU4_ORYBR
MVRCNGPGCSSSFVDGNGDKVDGTGAYPENAISTTKYTSASFVTIIGRAVLLYHFFLIIAYVSFSPLAPYYATSVLLQLIYRC